MKKTGRIIPKIDHFQKKAASKIVKKTHFL